jgi:hypothetical protein
LTCARAHHTCHGGYDKVGSFESVGSLESLSLWCGLTVAAHAGLVGLDWMVPEAWNVEHNNRHYYHYLSELTDPDLVEANLSQLQLRDMPIPLLLK